jgi:hypothetical protein
MVAALWEYEVEKSVAVVVMKTAGAASCKNDVEELHCEGDFLQGV